MLSFATVGTTPDDELGVLLRRHRRRALQAAGGAGRPADARGRARARSCAASASSTAGRASAARLVGRGRADVHDAQPSTSGMHAHDEIHPTRDRRPAARELAARRRRSAPTASSARTWRSARAPRSAPHCVIDGPHDASAATTASSSSPRSARRRRTRSTRASPRGWRSATATPSASSAPQPRHGAGRRRHPPRQRQLDHGLRAPRARLPGRQPHHLRQQRQLAGHVHVGDWAILGGFTRRAPVRARSARTRCTGIAHRAAAGRAALRDWSPATRPAARHQHRGPQAARLHARAHRGAQARLQARSTARASRSTRRSVASSRAQAAPKRADVRALLRASSTRSTRGIVR